MEAKGLINAWDELAGKYDHVSMKKNAESFYAEDKSCECGREGATKFCEWCRYDKCEKCFQEMKDECRHCDGQDKTPDGKWCEYCDGGEKYICHENNIPEFDWAVMEPEYPYDTTKEQMGYAAESFGADAAGFDGGYRCSTCDKQYLYHNDAKHGGCEKDRRLTDEDVGEGCKCMEEAEDRAEWCCTARAESFNAESNGDLQLDESKKRTKMSAIRTGLAITTFGIVLWNLWTNKKQESQISDIMDLV